MCEHLYACVHLLGRVLKKANGETSKREMKIEEDCSQALAL